ncbi:hypothetical protein HPP92_011439 [Vanilla planifolia]|uniref:Cytochrome c oxidase subunit 5C n=1 Tax=Vanilla planifolia TaxID=51239 RepID=A0A835V4F1_VANPL|nr:hypothetical protein HPP92_011439 [Vanilla planifolia]
MSFALEARENLRRKAIGADHFGFTLEYPDSLGELQYLVRCGKQKDLMAAHRVAHATLKGPSVVKEICIGITLGLIAGGLWKMHHWNEQRKTRAFYDMLEKGEISVVVPEE